MWNYYVIFCHTWSIYLVAVSVTDAAAVNPNSIKSIFFIKGKPVFSNGHKSMSENPPNYPPISCNWVFDNFIL